MVQPTDPAPKDRPELAGSPRSAGPGDSGAMLAWLKAMARRRRLRRSFFDPSFAVDPAWDMLIDLAIARLEGRSVSAHDLVDDVAGANPRWIRLLVEQGYCETEDSAAAAAATMRFTARGWDEMRRYVQAAAGPEINRD
ncbi:MAG: hypothetical protein Q7J32_17745 [Sphingomonadaceae bacterium]|nr:hypothetical protein [Sphingomonadaceae bacterium]